MFGLFGKFDRNIHDVAAIAGVMELLAKVKADPPRTTEDAHVFLLRFTQAVVNRAKIAESTIDQRFAEAMGLMAQNESVRNLLLFLIWEAGPVTHAVPLPIVDRPTEMIQERRFMAALERVHGDVTLRDRLKSELVKTVEGWPASTENTRFQAAIGDPGNVQRLLELLPTLNQLVAVLGE